VLELRALHAHVDRLGLGGLELGLRLYHVGLGRHTARVPILREAEEDPSVAQHAPYDTPVRRLDEAGAAKRPVIRQPL